MAISLTLCGQKQLDALLAAVLDAYATGGVCRDDAVATLAHIVTAAAIDEAEEVADWLDPARLERWRRELSLSRP